MRGAVKRFGTITAVDGLDLEVLGFRLPEESKHARAECGVVPQLDNLDTTLTVEQNLLVFS